MNIGANRNSHGKRTVSTKQPQVDSWAFRLWRGIELVFKSLDCHSATKSTRPITRMKSFSFFYLFIFFGGVVVVGWWGGGWGRGWWWVLSSNAFTIWCCIPISRPPRVIRRFKRRSCCEMFLEFSCIFCHSLIGKKIFLLSGKEKCK